ncbi:extracellular solute-binding protein [Pseudoruegeria sp. SK021]|uniref:extracellular solute-binding protein n=1 Tax=Pseudoruegeria sp. SK021 TaxID=1933035 RepID=UPI000A23DB93|nr:extracellular solute-binding protein [Pseudoruegeria sp. SK021]OSP55569.1 polyamine ABC transporter substrate-binding protein [Pseudoruegeria sp. SK021]
MASFSTRFLCSTAVVLGLSGPLLAADSELLIFDWSAFETDGFSTLYGETYGVHPTYTFFGDEEEAFQKLRSGFRADVAHPCTQSISKWRAADLIEPFDLSLIPSYGTVAEVYRTNPIFADDSGVYFIPTDLGATGIAYNSAEVPEADVQTLQVFQDPKYAGRMSLPDNVDDIYALAFLANGVTDWTTATPDDVEAASAWLRQVHENVRAYWTDGAELAQLMATGEILVSWSWNETPAMLKAEDFPVAFEREPVEGSSLWFCGYVNLKDGPGSEEKANVFVESFLQPSVADHMLQELGYASANTDAMADIDPMRLEEAGLNPISVPILAQLPMDNAIREKMIADFERIKAGF